MSQHIDIYCERVGSELWAEPLNALTNVSFIIAAIMAFLLAKRRGALSSDVILLIALLASVGAASGAFHTLASPMTMVLDVLAILLFQITFLAVYLLRVAKAHWLVVAGALEGYFSLSYGAGMIGRDVLNGSVGYLPALAFLLGLGVYHMRVKHEKPYSLLIAAGVLFVSLSFRSFDMELCSQMSIGTHFLWHILNGVVLYLSVRTVIYARSNTQNIKE